jgi:hypothetical protein
LKRSQGKAAAPSTARGRSAHLKHSKREGRWHHHPEKGNHTPELKLLASKKKKAKEAVPQTRKRGSSKDAVPSKPN